MKISVIIPMYNEDKIIRDTAKQVYEYMTERFGEGEFEVLFSNDGSLDKCAEAVSALELPGIKVTGYEKNRGASVFDGARRTCYTCAPISRR